MKILVAPSDKWTAHSDEQKGTERCSSIYKGNIRLWIISCNGMPHPHSASELLHLTLLFFIESVPRVMVVTVFVFGICCLRVMCCTQRFCFGFHCFEKFRFFFLRKRGFRLFFLYYNSCKTCSLYKFWNSSFRLICNGQPHQEKKKSKKHPLKSCERSLIIILMIVVIFFFLFGSFLSKRKFNLNKMFNHFNEVVRHCLRCI